MTLPWQSNADGFYRADLTSWENAETGPYTLAVQVEGFRTAQQEQIELGEQGTAENVDLQLGPPPHGRLTGQVFLPDGKSPATGVRIIPLWPGSTWPDPMVNSSVGTLDGAEYAANVDQATVTDAEGRYQIEGLEAGNYRVYAVPHSSRHGVLPDPPAAASPPDPRLSDTASTLSASVAVPEEGTGEVPVTLGVPIAGALEGMVRRAENGAPLPGVTLRVHPREAQRSFYFDLCW